LYTKYFIKAIVYSCIIFSIKIILLIILISLPYYYYIYIYMNGSNDDVLAPE